MKEVDLDDINYKGYDVVPKLITSLRDKFPGKYFEVLDITKDDLGCFDLIICRDLMVHLSNDQISKAINNFKSSGSTYLLSTTFTALKENQDLRVPIRGVGWRAINLELGPFFLDEPLIIITEVPGKKFHRHGDKSLGLWKIN